MTTFTFVANCQVITISLHLGGLYGAEGASRVQAVSGQVTAYVRQALELSQLLGKGGKNRDDHRHHAVDAIAIALTSPGLVRDLSRSASLGENVSRRKFKDMPEPWPGYAQEMREVIQGAVVSFRVERKLRGPLHKESFYGKRHDSAGQEYTTRRKPLQDMSSSEVESIVDPVIRQAALDRMGALGVSSPVQAFKEEGGVFIDGMRNGEKARVLVRKALTRRKENTVAVGDSGFERNVEGGSNHHLAIFETTDKRGNPMWEGEVVTMLEASQRRRFKEPVVRREQPTKGQFVCSLVPGDTVLMEQGKPESFGPGLYRIRTISSRKKEGSVNAEIVALNDARMKAEIRATGDWKMVSVEALRRAGCRKVIVTPLGDVRWSND